MRIRDLAFIGFALTAFGCSRPPKAVFIDLDLIDRLERPPEVALSKWKPKPRVSIPAQQATLPRSPGVLLLDRAEGKIQLARKLIEADREMAIRTLSRRLASARSEEIDKDKLKALEALEKEQIAYLRQVYDQLFEIFDRYARQRGPKSGRADLLKVRKPDLYVSRTSPTKYAQQQKAELDAILAEIKKLDQTYDRQAQDLLNNAQVYLGSQQGSLQAQFETLRANAIDQAQRDARSAIGKSSQTTDLKLGQNKSVVVSEVRGESVRVAGSSQSTEPVQGLDTSPVVSLAERRASLEQQLEIWLKTNGFVRASTRSAGSDQTEEFNSWRKSHRLGR
jgi:hypothetical protein